MEQYLKENLKNLTLYEINAAKNLIKAAAKYFVGGNDKRATELIATCCVVVGDFDMDSLFDVEADLNEAWRLGVVAACEKHGMDYEQFREKIEERIRPNPELQSIANRSTIVT